MEKFTQDICWIYITESGDALGSRNIVFCGDEDLSHSLDEHLSQGERLVYSRRFDNTFDALAHKLMLNTLSFQTVSRIINQHK